MGVPPNHPFMDGIFHGPSSYWGVSPDYGNPPISVYLGIFVVRSQVEYWEKTLAHISEVTESIQSVQKSWMQLGLKIYPLVNYLIVCYGTSQSLIGKSTN
jgi:hypothetical protein